MMMFSVEMISKADIVIAARELYPGSACASRQGFPAVKPAQFRVFTLDVYSGEYLVHEVTG